MPPIESVLSGAVVLAIIGVLTWVLKNKSDQDKWVQTQSERNALALEKNTTASILLADNVKKNTETTQAMLELLKQVIKRNGHNL